MKAMKRRFFGAPFGLAQNDSNRAFSVLLGGEQNHAEGFSLISNFKKNGENKMNELEKAKKNLFGDIDYSKIIDEAKEELENHHDFMESFRNKDFETFKAQIGPSELFKEAETMLFLINAIINYLPTDKQSFVQYAAAISVLGKIMSGKLSKKDKTKYEMIMAVLEASTMAISREV